MRFYKFLTTVLFLAPLLCSAQNSEETDITGLWKGTLYNDTTGQFYKYEIGISQDKKGLSGFSHTWFILDDKQYFGVKKVKIKRVDGKIIIEDDGLISNNYPVAPAKGVKQLNILVLNASDSVMTLSGPFSTNRTKEYRSLTGSIMLERKNDYWQSALVPHLQELNLSNQLSFVEDENLLSKKYLAFNAQDQKQIESGENMKDHVRHDVDGKTIPRVPAGEINKPVVTDKAVVSAVSTSKPIIKKNNPVPEMTVITTSTSKKPTASTAADAELTRERPDLTVNKADSVYAILLPVAPVAQKPIMEADKIVNADKAITRDKMQITAPVKPAVMSEPIAEQKTRDPAAAAYDVSVRTTTIQQTVSFRSDSLQLSLYDNGEVDGDTVSVLMNGGIIMAKERLSTNAVRKTIYIPKDMDTVQLIMYAENLGSIPPNTGLLVVKDGKDLYEIRFSGDLQKNAAIIFNRKKETPK